MCRSILLWGIACLFFAGDLFAQTDAETKDKVQRIVNDSGVHPVRGKDRVFAVDKANKMGLETLLGLSKAHAMAIISHFENKSIIDHQEYPYIKDVVEITKFKRWDFPIFLYVFIDSSDQVCRLSYQIDPENGMSEPEARTILEQLRKDHAGLNVLKESDWEIAGWEESDRFYFFTWDKQLPVIKPTYLVTLKTYVDDHLLPYLSTTQILNDAMFTPIPTWMLKK